MKHLNITVKGRVQGVYFRVFTEQKAKSLGIKGHVKNLPDGSVYIEAEAPSEVLDAFVKWCHKGSPLSKVEEVSVTEETLKHFADFGIQR